MSRTIRPEARQDDLVVQSATDELLVYDNQSDRAYVLSPAAAAVWRASNGKRTVPEIASYLSQETLTDEQTVWYALGQMQDLLREPVQMPQELVGMSRRKFLQRASIVAAAAAVPVVVSLVAPTPAHAQSGTVACKCVIASCSESVTCGAQCIAFCAGSGGITVDSCGPGLCPT